MGIPSLNSAILYNVSLYFHYKDPSLPLRMTPKSLKYSKYPELIETIAIEVELIEPILDIREEEVFDLALAIVENL